VTPAGTPNRRARYAALRSRASSSWVRQRLSPSPLALPDLPGTALLRWFGAARSRLELGDALGEHGAQLPVGLVVRG
jgi:hypothetical protein